MTATTIRLTINDDFAKILAWFRGEFPLLSDPELIKMAVSGFFVKKQQESLQVRWKAWDASLPYIELSDEAQDSIAEALKEGPGKPMTVEEIMAFTDPDND